MLPLLGKQQPSQTLRQAQIVMNPSPRLSLFPQFLAQSPILLCRHHSDGVPPTNFNQRRLLAVPGISQIDVDLILLSGADQLGFHRLFHREEPVRIALLLHNLSRQDNLIPRYRCPRVVPHFFNSSSRRASSPRTRVGVPNQRPVPASLRIPPERCNPRAFSPLHRVPMRRGLGRARSG